MQERRSLLTAEVQALEARAAAVKNELQVRTQHTRWALWWLPEGALNPWCLVMGCI